MDIQSVKQRFGIVSTSERLDSALEVALRVAPTDLTVLVTGESGVGKEFFPQVVHAYSPRKHEKYVVVNCGAIPEGTIDSELFGHEKGAFTGAVEARKGYFEEANKGTIFLDEVAELPLSTQVRLLRVLQTGEFMRVGSAKTLKTDVRVVAATNKNLPDMVAAGRFREDLYYRLNTVPVLVPPLRERVGDIHLLFRRFATEIATQYRMPAISLDADARAALEEYSWPGNVRQLKNVAQQISAIEPTREITAEVVRKYLPADGFTGGAMTFASAGGGHSFGDERELLYRILFDMRSDIARMSRTLDELSRRSEGYFSPVGDAPGEGGGGGDIKGFLPAPVAATKDDATREAIEKALIRTGGRRKEAAELLFISERTLYRKMKELGIE